MEWCDYSLNNLNPDAVWANLSIRAPRITGRPRHTSPMSFGLPNDLALGSYYLLIDNLDNLDPHAFWADHERDFQFLSGAVGDLSWSRVQLDSLALQRGDKDI